MITIIDYKTGNLGSIQNILKRIGEESIITSDKNEIANAKKLILPGVGAFDTGMANLNKLDLVDILNYKVLVEKTPVLGICLGMQILSKNSEEGFLPGLGWINAETRRFKFIDTNKYKIPHMGWNQLDVVRDHPLVHDLVSGSYAYFVHSYAIYPEDQTIVLATTDYGGPFASIVGCGNICGLQFHPEKSQAVGLKLLRNFLSL